jgi:hypothetical protein
MTGLGKQAKLMAVGWCSKEREPCDTPTLTPFCRCREREAGPQKTSLGCSKLDRDEETTGLRAHGGAWAIPTSL